MLIIDSKKKQEYLLKGKFGLEMESLRIDRNGYLSHTEHPFLNHQHIVKDFCENQTEINTSVEDSPHSAVMALYEQYKTIQRKLSSGKDKELLWPFSNPPYIRNENDIPIANFNGKDKSKTDYRNYLSDKYGRYKMAFSGIHVNYSFDEELFKLCFNESGMSDYQEYKNQVYVDLAEKLAVYGWILVAVTAASPILDSSFLEKGKMGEDVFLGLASVRCSELGYWNFFTPIFDYENVRTYTQSISDYIENKLISAPSELYYPIRLKPKGENTLESLKTNGIDHIELRMFDLNPLAQYGVDERDIIFAQLLMGWLITKPRERISIANQVQTIQNFKNAAHYDLKTVKIVLPNGKVDSVVDAAKSIIDEMKIFYADYPIEILRVLDFQEEKFIDAERRYAWIVRKKFGEGFVKNGLDLALKRQGEAYV